MKIYRMKCKDLMLASGNRTKQLHHDKFFQSFTKPKNVNIKLPQDMGYEPIEVKEYADKDHDLLDNALLKARAYWDAYHVPVLADDSGLFIYALDMWPGLITGRCNDPGKTIGETILDRMKDVTNGYERKAVYRSCIVFIDTQGRAFFCETARDGYISYIRSGENCNEVEKIFVPEVCGVGSAKLLPEGSYPIEERIGQNYQMEFAYPRVYNKNAFGYKNFMDVIIDCVWDENAFPDIKKEDLCFCKFEENGEPIPYVGVAEFAVPRNPQELVDMVMSSRIGQNKVFEKRNEEIRKMEME